tara:strand:- start:1045 stop:1785 length:741 start_codon:yes stop_codon:yes gene_type:complete
MTTENRSTEHLKAVAYFRVSTDKQAQSGLGLEAQQDAVQAFAAASGFDVIQTFTDAGVSGKTDLAQRPGLLQAIEAAKEEGAQTLIVAKLCRLSRDVLNSMLIERTLGRSGIKLVSAAGEGTGSDDPSAVLLRNLLQAVNAYEARVIGARTKAALAAKKARSEKDGTWAVGHPPKGFTVDERGFLVPNKDFPLVLKALTLRLNGMSTRKIARELALPNHVGVLRWTNYWLDKPEQFLSYVPAYQAR